MGTKFDQEFTKILKHCFDTNDFSKLPEYKYLYDKGYRTVSGQVTIKATNIKNSRPDNLLFVTKVENGRRVIDYRDMIYIECKIRETSYWTDLQVEVLDKLEKNLVALTDLEFEVAFDSKDRLFLKGDKISIWEVHQASLDEINSVFVTKKIF